MALAVLYAVTGLAVTDAREALRAVGHDEGPTVTATADVRNALSDMDAEVATVLLTGREAGWLCDPERSTSCVREQPRYRYDIRREDAQRAALRAARLAQDDPVRLRTVQALIDGLHRYDQKVQAAMREGARRGHAYGYLPAEAADEYRAAQELMSQELLPKAANLAAGWAAALEETYRGERSEILTGRAVVFALGAAALGVLAWLQVYLARRFRRMLNPCLAAATLGTLVLTVASASLLGAEAGHLRSAKEGGIDPALALARAQAIAKTMHADRSRYLFDPQGAARYDVAYTGKSAEILGARGKTSSRQELADHYARLPRDGTGPVSGGGLYGDHRAGGLGDLVPRYLAYQDNDRRVRDLAESGKRGAAAKTHIDPQWPHLPHPRFRDHEQALDARIGHYRYVAGAAVLDGERALEVWGPLRPPAVLALAALLVAGVWPRLSEYR